MSRNAVSLEQAAKATHLPVVSFALEAIEQARPFPASTIAAFFAAIERGNRRIGTSDPFCVAFCKT
ncbi:hypothetical protein [Xanthomonas translucens]|uniref:Uncharacterized protein n=1 Tax=Xanthomonas translucens pv. translucens TaxID=134875 RepID=A0ABW9KTX2_XANCT|nr:hypothetical protein [Xanthomonas translucens]MCC8447416.1 hypothetical protein [Xanthomonas translucens pv. translucens]MCS3360069.1 hypothetical protein [Xanthomonas translucens pv. translucens]MCS3373957.1 hypothetical protein [Xanthomonas translucens pv. translucens]MCT8274754.1 hypothetical protein [Xanthomonas translucens pv. translucens]MCT8278474.1 hypothetical protein [Xanthomonas translucens pv. translucens]